MRKRESKKKSLRCVPSQPVIENTKKIAKKFKKFENTIVASFLAEIGCEKLRKTEKKKKNSFDVFLPDWELKIPKK